MAYYNEKYDQQYGDVKQTINTNAVYAYEEAKRTSVAKVYGEMTVGLIVTALVAMFSQSTGAFEQFLIATGKLGWIGIVLVQVALSAFLGIRIMKMNVVLARIIFYAYAAITGFTISIIFDIFKIKSIVIVFALTAGFFLCLTMLALTTKINMLKAGPIIFAGLITLVIAQFVLMFLTPSNNAIKIISAIGILVFAGLTAYDAQKTRALFEEYDQQPEIIKRISILCALQLYLDFINMFVYLLQLLGDRRE